MRIALTGGGSGGHFYPILAVAHELRAIAAAERIIDLRLYYFGSKPLRPELLAEDNIEYRSVAAGKVRAYASFRNVLDMFVTAFGVFQALGNILVVMPDVIFSKGGYDSFPTLVAARIFRIPVVIHESDAVPGRVNQWAGKWAARVAVAYPEAGKFFPDGKVALTGIPIRKGITGGTRAEAGEFFGVYSDRPVVFITGGSQGAKVINQAVVEILAKLLERFEVIHQVGEANFEDLRFETAPILKEGGGERYYHMVASLAENEMRDAYLLADIIVSRAGSTIFEIAAWGKPAILIPLRIAAQDHQRANAYAYAATGAAVVVEEANLTPSLLLHEITNIADHPARRVKMAEAAKVFSRTDAAEVIAREVFRIGTHES